MKYDPSNIWTYNKMSSAFDGYGLGSLGAHQEEVGNAHQGEAEDHHGFASDLISECACQKRSEQARAGVDGN
ncbi:MAG: hypothetical protein NTW69_20850 [Chloroflexi bacterium]|nr:hypothetical protein [Chloroflexota bacterium]